MSGHIHPADWAVQCIPPWGVWAGIIFNFCFPILCQLPPLKVTRRNLHTTYICIFYAEI